MHKKQSILSEKNLYCLIAFALFVNALAIFSPFMYESDATWYFILAKQIAHHGQWSSLFLNELPWLDKPHFPFWAEAASFKLFGIHPWSYILPGFLFNVLGAIYTYKLTKLLYDDKVTAALAMLIYLTAIRLMWCSVDVKAEAFLGGQIMPACYYWLRYDRESKLTHLFWGALFTALAVMTKGLFLMITAASGLAVFWIYQKKYRNFFSLKWISALLLTLFFVLPELIALYKQFAMDGIKWFFLESQFGRFFGTGRIARSTIDPTLYIRSIFSSFAPWCVVLVLAIWHSIKHFKSSSSIEKNNTIYLMGYFFVTFVILSTSKFQYEFYIVVILPFATIISANFLTMTIKKFPQHWIFKFQLFISAVFLLILIAIPILASSKTDINFWLWSVMPFLFIIAMVFLRKKVSLAERAVTFSALMVILLFGFSMLLKDVIFSKFNAGYNIAQFLKSKPMLPIYIFPVAQSQAPPAHYYAGKYRNTAMIYIDTCCTHLAAPPTDLPPNAAYYVIVREDDLQDALKVFPKSTIVFVAPDLYVVRFEHTVLASPEKFKAAQTQMMLLKVN